MVSFTISAFFSCWAWTCSYRPLVEKMVIQRPCQGIFRRREFGLEGKGIEQWGCSYKNSHALLHAFSGWKIFSIRNPSILIFFFFFFYNVTVRKKRNPKSWLIFRHIFGKLLSELVWMVSHSWTTMAIQELIILNYSWNSQPWHSEHCVW